MAETPLAAQVAGPPLYKNMFGRRELRTDEVSITRDNVLSVIDDVVSAHEANATETKYLWDYYRGKTPILGRVKQFRPEVCNNVSENRAQEIVNFNLGYIFGEPIQYLGSRVGEGVSRGVSALNNLMLAENKAAKDIEIGKSQEICGTAYRLVLPDAATEADDAPFEIWTLDPASTFVVYGNTYAKRPLLGVTYSEDEKTRVRTYDCYTEREFFRISGRAIDAEKSRPHILGMVPIFEYPANAERTGSFEIVLPILDAINNLQSNRIDGVEQFVNAFLKFVNCDIDEEGIDRLRQMGAIKIRSIDGVAKADVDIVSSELNQDQVQTLLANLEETYRTICGVPRTGNSTSDARMGASLVGNGWTMAETRAKHRELLFKQSEQRFLKLTLEICRMKSAFDLRLSDLDMRFTRRNYEGLQSKSQVLISMLGNDKIHPLVAYSSSGMFTDPMSAYELGMEWHEKGKAAQAGAPKTPAAEGGESGEGGAGGETGGGFEDGNYA